MEKLRRACTLSKIQKALDTKKTNLDSTDLKDVCAGVHMKLFLTFFLP